LITQNGGFFLRVPEVVAECDDTRYKTVGAAAQNQTNDTAF